MKTNLKRRDYHKCQWSRTGLICAVAKSAGVVMCFAFFFYRSIWAVLPLAFVGAAYFRIQMQRQKSRSKEELTNQFKECILSVATALKAGYAVENAFLESRADMEMLFGIHSYIYQELEFIRRGLVINITLEEQLTDLAERSDSEEVRQFVTVLTVARKSGGNLPGIIQEAAELIGRRADARKELQVLLSGRRMEQTIMKLVPFGVLLYIGFSYPGYFDVLYHNLQGIAIMTVCVAIYLTAYLLGERIMEGIRREMM